MEVTIENFCDAVQELYTEWCEKEGQGDGTTTRLPDFEKALTVIREKAVLPNGSEEA